MKGLSWICRRMCETMCTRTEQLVCRLLPPPSAVFACSQYLDLCPLPYFRQPAPSCPPAAPLLQMYEITIFLITNSSNQLSKTQNPGKDRIDLTSATPGRQPRKAVAVAWADSGETKVTLGRLRPSRRGISPLNAFQAVITLLVNLHSIHLPALYGAGSATAHRIPSRAR